MVLIFTHGNPNIDLFKRYIDNTSRLFSFLWYKLKDLMIAPGLRRIGAINKENKLIQKAKEIGEQLAL
ncbi:MAG: hypothetical protein ACFFG0_27220 [Candidatus Thorarchaeota archaeon]